MNDEGFVPLPFIADFKRMQNLTTDLEFVLAVLMTSEHLTVYQPNTQKAIGSMIRPRDGWQQWVLAPIERLDLRKMESPERRMSENVYAHRPSPSLGQIVFPPSDSDSERFHNAGIFPYNQPDGTTPRRASTSLLQRPQNAIPAIRMPPRRPMLPIATPVGQDGSRQFEYTFSVPRARSAARPRDAKIGEVATALLDLDISENNSTVKQEVKSRDESGHTEGKIRAQRRSSLQADMPEMGQSPGEGPTLGNRTMSPKKNGTSRFDDSALLDEDDEDPFGNNYMEEQMAGVERFVKGWGSRATSQSINTPSPSASPEVQVKPIHNPKINGDISYLNV